MSKFSIDNFINHPTISNAKKKVIEDREIHLKHVLNYVETSGYILEFGVYQGFTINIISEKFPEKEIWGFDSFEGLPEDWITTDQNEIVWPKGHFAVSNLPKVNKNVKLVKGWFNNTLPDWLKKQTNNVSFLHIDCDLYSSTSTVLTALNDRIVKDTIILFDEIYHFSKPKKYTNWSEGEYKALIEWIDKFDREVEVLSKNKHMQAAVRVLK